jgi:hypothetical protein
MRKIFYHLKPVIPRFVQLFLRRKLVKKQREKYQKVWPILESASVKPAGWPGWPNNKKFAFVITHDVEHRGGHDKCRELASLERRMGFRSSFNFVPERYKVDESLRDFLTENGFEVGVHGLKHDGKLFDNRKIFLERAEKINMYLKEWRAVGFRAPAMHHNLEWIKDLNIEYDLSTFDSDPFEPQSDGVGTIFPFIVDGGGIRSTYVEMPYTLVQDFTLFVLMKEPTAEIWKRKVDWIAKHGGMVLVNVHPDYINFNNVSRGLEEFSVDQYIELLEYVETAYKSKYYHDLPREVARYFKKVMKSPSLN